MGREASLKEEIKKLMKIPGKVRGQVFVTDLRYIKIKEGEEGIKAYKQKLRDWNVPLDWKKLKVTDWYPVGWRALSLLACKEVFGWGDKEIWDLRNNAPKYSFIVRMLMKYFLSPKKTFEESPKYWRKYYDVGELEAHEFNEKEKYLVSRLRNFKIHPILCTLFCGYFLRIAQYVIQGKKITIEKTKCKFKGDPYHEFIIRWT